MKLFSTLSLFFLATLAFAAQPLVIKMKSLSYDPKIATVSVGEPVVWKNDAYTDHTATSTDKGTASFDTGIVHPGKSSKRVTFDKAGTYNYQCSIHGKTMSGTIQVQAAPAR